MQQEFDYTGILEECKEAASVGYKIASQQQKKLGISLQEAVDRINATLLDFNNSTCQFANVTDLLGEQLKDISSELHRISFAFKDDLVDLHEKLSRFSITLFGRTMAGKSTLMELLTHGDGASIGKGSQRTTQDVRTYTWNGLSITDVPGIAAFNGLEDEMLAFDAARKADLILFLLTDDAPQEAEAECLSEVINLGKPVICVLNVKASISEEKAKIGIRDIVKSFNQTRLDEIKAHFLSYSEQYGQNWSHIPFIYVHLKSAFMAQKTQNQELSDQLITISRIKQLENCILSQVYNKGRFYRIKNFIDIVSNPLLLSMEQLLSQSIVNSTQGRTILSKRRQLETWRKSFYRDGISSIRSFVTSVAASLHTEIAPFAEDHFDDTNADKAWNTLVKERHTQDQCQSILEELSMQCNEKLSEISREITSELAFSSTVAFDRTLRMGPIIDGKRIWDWSATIIGGGLSIASIVTGVLGAACAGPLGLAALAVGAVGVLGSWLFKDRNKQELEARTKLEQLLTKNVDMTCSKLQKQMESCFLSDILKRVDDVLHEIDRVNEVIFQLADTQKSLAWGLDKHLLEINMGIFTEALKLIDADGLQFHVQEVARVPGHTVMLSLNDGVHFPNDQKSNLQRLMNEQLCFVFPSENRWRYVARIMGNSVDRKRIRIEEKIDTVHIPAETIDRDTLTRIRLAQQLTRTVILPD